jgi:pyruvate dehydrogenase (quinone)
MNVGDFLVQRLSEWGVRRIYGYPGDGINGIMGALARAEDRMEFVQVRHEEMSAFMASAHAKSRERSASVSPPPAQAPSTS